MLYSVASDPLGLCVYLSQYQLLPLARTQELLLDLLGQGTKPGNDNGGDCGVFAAA